MFTPFDLSNAFHLDPDAYKNGVHHTPTYQHSNVNGEVKESGTINGRKMTEQETSRSFFRNGLRGIRALFCVLKKCPLLQRTILTAPRAVRTRPS